tara:strand:+ start:1710 stop:1883 length:174 start_codon:yes stop_codon:yes gene_type:complete
LSGAQVIRRIRKFLLCFEIGLSLVSRMKTIIKIVHSAVNCNMNLLRRSTNENKSNNY